MTCRQIYVSSDAPVFGQCDWLILVWAPHFVDSGAFDRAIKTANGGRGVPKGVAILSLRDPNLSTEEMTNEPAIQYLLERLPPSVTKTVFLSVNVRGTCHIARSITGADKNWEACSSLEADALVQLSKRAGLMAIVDEAGARIIQPAPKGHAFSKPSGRVSNYFLRADGCLDDSTNAYFLAFCLLDRIDHWQQRHPGQTLSVIYIDSMAISPIAFAIGLLLDALRTDNTPRTASRPAVQSFHSYDGLENISPQPNPDCSLCLISASSATGLALRWQERFAIDESATITLFSFQADSEESPVLFRLEKPADFNESNGGRKQLVRVVGESFMYESAASRAVMVRQPHAPKNLKNIAHFLAKDAFRIAEPRGDDDTSRAVHVAGSTAIELEGFDKWLALQVDQWSPRQVRAIIHLNDEGSTALGQRVASLLGVTTVYSQRDIDALEGAIGGAIVICAAAIQSGNDLLALSRALRPIHDKAARLTIIGYAVPDSNASFSRLKNDLSKGGDNNYQIRERSVFPVASRPIESSFRMELDIWQAVLIASETTDDDKIIIRERISQISKGLRGDQCILSRDESPLKVQPGFVFWPKREDVTPHSQAEALVTIGVVLQHLRESHDIKPEDSLAASSLQHVILDAGVFARFNDGLLQAAFLRCAYDEELDYSHDRGMSQQITRMLLDGFSYPNAPRADCLCELVLAILIGRLQLHKDDLTMLTKSSLVAPTTTRLRLLVRQFRLKLDAKIAIKP